MIKSFSVVLFLFFSCFSFADGPFNVTYKVQEHVKIVTGKPFRGGLLFNESSIEPLRLVTLDWPPYIDNNLCNKGWVYQLTVAIFTEAGLSFYIEFLPWARAVRDAELGRADILFPEYFIEASAPSDTLSGATRLSLLTLSAPFPGGEVSLIKRKDMQIGYNGILNQLKQYSFGVVRGYQNTPEFDALMDAKVLKTIEAVDDFQLVTLLINKRVDLIVSDPAVARNSVLLSNLPLQTKTEWIDKLDIVTPYLAYNPLYFAVSRRAEHSQTVLDKINSTLFKFKQDGTLEHIIENAKSSCQTF